MEWVSDQRESILHAQLLQTVHLISFAPPVLTLRLAADAPPELPHQLSALLRNKTGAPWTVAISQEMGQTTLHEKAEEASEARRAVLLNAPVVKALMTAFPGSTLIHENHT